MRERAASGKHMADSGADQARGRWDGNRGE